MTDALIRIRFWGVRGSLPVAGPKYREFGGNTVCIEVRCGDDVLLFDAGSGIMPAGKALKAEGMTSCNLFFSHFHYDHVIGLPYFPPLYDPSVSIGLWSGHLSGRMTTAEMLDGLLRSPWFPVGPKAFSARLVTHDFEPGDALSPLSGVTVRTGRLTHPDGSTGYRIEFGGRALAVITDTEHVPGVLDPVVLDLIRDADLFLYDGCYLEDEMARYRGYGHSTWQQAVLLGRAAGARRIALIHHAPFRSDRQLRDIERDFALEFPGAFVARDGQEVSV